MGDEELEIEAGAPEVSADEWMARAALFELLRDACIKRGIPWQTKTRVAGGTDAGRIHRSRAGVRVCAAAAPVRYIHSPSSVAAKADCEAVLAVARAFLEELGGDDE